MSIQGLKNLRKLRMLLKSFCADSGPSKLFPGAGEMNAHPGRTLVQHEDQSLKPRTHVTGQAFHTPKTLASKRVKTGGPLGLADFWPA